jgi:ElaA protein
LDPDTLHAFLKLRSDIFVVEQNCVFSDMDGIDPQCEHLCGTDTSGNLLAYLRLVPPGLRSQQPALGRLVVSRRARSAGLARAAMLQGIRHCMERYPDLGIFLHGQQYLESFYASMGFAAVGAPYLDDGIPHVDMLRNTSRPA